MHKCQAVIVGPQDHEIELIVAIFEIVNTPPRRHIPVGSQGSCRGRAPAGTADLAACPNRGKYPAGAAGENEYEEDMRSFEAGNIGKSGNQCACACAWAM